MRVPSDDYGRIQKETFADALLGHVILMATIQENVRQIQRVDKMIENDLEEHFQVWVPMSSNIVKYKEGIHFPAIKQLLSLVRENEDMKHQLKLKKQRFVEEARRNNQEEFSDEYEDEENS